MKKTPSFAVPDSIATHPAWFRLEDQCNYYNSKAVSFQQHYKRIKVALILLAASIPVLSLLQAQQPELKSLILLVAMVGAAMAALEAVLMLNRYPDLWVRYRGTAESLKRERWLLLARSGEYRGLDETQALALLADRVELLLELEHREWTSEQKKALDRMSGAPSRRATDRLPPPASQPAADEPPADAPAQTAPPPPSAESGAPESAAPASGR